MSERAPEAGTIFIDEMGDAGPGVRLRKRWQGSS
jgi:hypothetical protein